MKEHSAWLASNCQRQLENYRCVHSRAHSLATCGLAAVHSIGRQHSLLSSWHLHQHSARRPRSVFAEARAAALGQTLDGVLNTELEGLDSDAEARRCGCGVLVRTQGGTDWGEGGRP